MLVAGWRSGENHRGGFSTHTHAHTHANTHAHTHAYTHAHTHAHANTHARTLFEFLLKSFSHT